MIEFRNVSKRFPGTASKALDGLSLSIPRGCFFVLLGGSGSGKTTLLKTVNRLITDFDGQVFIEGEDNRAIADATLRRRCAFVFQNHALLPHLTVAKNISLPLELRGVARADIMVRVRGGLDQMGLDPATFCDRFPDELSGGQAQRVGVARALVSDPDVVLMDEPFSALDGLTRSQLQAQIKELKRASRATFLLVTHDLLEAIELADQMAVLHEGRLQQVGTPNEILEQPATQYILELFRKPRELLGRGKL
jgi:osmoprotectant transport system ATP-binding protein